MTLPNSFCVLPWIHLDVAPDGAVGLCAEFRGEAGQCVGTTIPEVWQNDDLAQVRQSFLSGIPPAGCGKCFEREASGETSLRQKQNKEYAQEVASIAAAADPLTAVPAAPVAIDLRFSNLCNFKCRSCWHGSSSKWFTDAKQLGQNLGESAVIKSFEGADAFLDQLGAGLENLKHIYFAGGEPLLQEEHYDLLERLIALGRTDIRLMYNSNMSVLAFRDRAVVDLWRQFPCVWVEASVDATGPLGANIRSGFDWDVFVTNVMTLRRACPHVELFFGTTVSNMNVLALPDVLDALEESCGATADAFHVHSLQEQALYRTQVLPLELKNTAMRQIRDYQTRLSARTDILPARAAPLNASLDGVVTFMMAQDLSHLMPAFSDLTHRLDHLRDEDSADDFGQLGTYLRASHMRDDPRPNLTGKCRSLWQRFRAT